MTDKAKITPREDHALLDDNHNVIPLAVWRGADIDTEALIRWAKWFEDTGKRRVAETIIDGVRISTIFLGLDYSLGPGPPLWFETMIFGEPDYEERCTTWEQAEEQHARAIAHLKGMQPE